jgi:AbrB family looped-hinge helix DNA binding protein
MITTVSSKGQVVLPKALRELAHISEGDQLEVGFSGGMLVLRKPEPLDMRKVRRLLKEGRALPELNDEAAAEVEAAIQRVRRQASR